MKTTTLRDRLNQAEALLERALDEPRIRVPITEDITGFLETLEEDRKAASNGDGSKVLRFATFENPETGNEVTKRVTKDGKLSPANQEATGLEYVDEWHEVRAPDRPSALDRIEAGQATKYVREDGEVRKVKGPADDES